MSQIAYQLRIELTGSEPPVWRRIQVLGQFPLSDLHDILQTAMGWQNEHFYQFIINDRIYGDPELGSGDNRVDAETASIGSLIKRAKVGFIYEYDFDDGWEHEIIVEKIRPMPDEEAATLPRCLEGEGACPPEDCGGIFGYFELLEALNDPEHHAYPEMKRLYAHLDPMAFDIEAVNRRLGVLFVADQARDESAEAEESQAF